MNAEQVAGLTLAALMLLWLVLDRVAKKRARARAARFREHAAQALDLVAADDRNTRLTANANGRGWY